MRLFFLTGLCSATGAWAVLNWMAATAFGVFDWVEVLDFDLLFSFLSFVSLVCMSVFLVGCLLFVTPNSYRRSPVKSCFVIKSLRRINLSFLRFGHQSSEPCGKIPTEKVLTVLCIGRTEVILWRSPTWFAAFECRSGRWRGESDNR